MRISTGRGLTWMGIRHRCLNFELTRRSNSSNNGSVSRQTGCWRNVTPQPETAARERQRGCGEKDIPSRDQSIRSPHGLTYTIQLTYSIPPRSWARTISCPELLTVSLVGGTQSYSTQKDFSIRKAQRGIDRGSDEGQTWPTEDTSCKTNAPRGTNEFKTAKTALVVPHVWTDNST